MDTYRTETHLNWWAIGLTAASVLLVLAAGFYFLRRGVPRLAIPILGCLLALVALAAGDDWRVLVALILVVAMLGWFIQRRNAAGR